jgi:hypothetical protein
VYPPPDKIKACATYGAIVLPVKNSWRKEGNMTESQRNGIQDIQDEGLRLARILLYREITRSNIPNEYLAGLEQVMEDIYRVGIETEADAMLFLFDEEEKQQIEKNK